MNKPVTDYSIENPLAKFYQAIEDACSVLLRFDSLIPYCTTKKQPVQGVMALRSRRKVRYPDGTERTETHVVRICQIMPDQPAVITGTLEYWDATTESHCYEYKPAVSLLSDVSYRTAEQQMNKLIELFKSLPREESWGSVDDVQFVNAADADPIVVDLIYEVFGEVNEVRTE